jgi:hypothetical protein
VKAAGRLAKDLLRQILDAERLTHAGRVNSLAVVLGFVVVLASGAFDLIQVIVRIWRPGYTTGLPAVTMFAIWVGLALFCVLIVIRLTGRHGSGDRSP